MRENQLKFQKELHKIQIEEISENLQRIKKIKVYFFNEVFYCIF